MQNHFSSHITSEKDLTLYEKFLHNDSVCHEDSAEKTYTKPNAMINPIRANQEITCISHSSEMMNPIFFQGYLKNNIGKLVRVESLLNGRLESRIGMLFSVGADYIVLKLNRGCSTMMITSADIKYITIIHDNDSNKIIDY